MENLVVCYIIIGLIILAAILVLVRLVLAISTGSPGRSVGKSMTIGSREVQEDSFAVVEAGGGTLAVLADGMGKALGGKVAGKIAVDTFVDLFGEYDAFANPQYYFRKAFHAANHRILGQFEEGMGGASVAVALIHGKTLYYSVVGNVRLAVFRGGELITVTEGHTVDVLAQQKFKKGQLTRQDTLALLQERRLYNYVGREEFRDVEIFDEPLQLKHSDLVVLLSDGVYETVPLGQLEDILRTGKDCQQLAYQIIEAINQAPQEDKDNASIIVIRP